MEFQFSSKLHPLEWRSCGSAIELTVDVYGRNDQKVHKAFQLCVRIPVYEARHADDPMIFNTSATAAHSDDKQ